jgi:nucleoside-diphosphate-sugar epimerase
VKTGRYLVTGSAGFIGVHLVDRLLAEGSTVVGIDRRPTPFRPTANDSAFHCFDIRDIKRLVDVVKGETFDAVVHLAGTSGVRAIDVPDAEYISNNVDATSGLLEALNSSRTRRFIFASSSSVYGDTEAELLVEDAVLGPSLSVYSYSKQLCERSCLAWASATGISTTVLRLFTTYGSGARPDMAVARFLTAFETNSPIVILGSGSESRDYIHVDDVVRAFLASMRRLGAPEVFNVGTGVATSTHELSVLMSNEFGLVPQILYRPADQRDMKRTCACVEKAGAHLGFRAEVSLSTGIAETISWRRMMLHSSDLGEESPSLG